MVDTTDLAITKTVSDPTPNVGDQITFTVLLSNQGPDSATGVQVSDLLPAGLSFVSADVSQGSYDNGTGLWDVGTVSPASSQTLKVIATVVSPAARTNTGTISAADQFDPDMSNNTGSATETPQRADLSLTKAVSDATPNVGDQITFTVELSNEGPDAARGVQVSDLLPAGLSFVSASPSQGSYDNGTGLWNVGTVGPGVFPTLTVTATVVSLDTQINTGTISAADQFDPDTANNTDSATAAPRKLSIVSFVNGQDADNPTGPHVAAGSILTHTYVVTNTGDVALANVVVADDKLGAIASFTGDSNGNGLLDLAETWIYTTTATALDGQQTNTGTVTALDVESPPGTIVTGSNPANYFGDTPAIQIVKFVNGLDADTPTGALASAGSPVTFTYVVTNTGNVALANVVVADDKLGPITSFTGDSNGDGLLDLTESWIYTTTATAQAGQQTSVGTVTGQDLNIGTTVTDDNPANYFGYDPAIRIVKFVNGQDANSPNGPQVPIGSSVTYTYVVTNTGNVPLANVAVSDDKLGTIAGPISGDANNNGLLDLTETWVYAQTATALAGQQANVGTVTGQDPNTGFVVTDDNPASYVGGVPAIRIVKFVNGQDADSPTGPHVATGSTVTFTYVVTNTHNVPLAEIVVTDDKLGPITSFTGDTNTNGLLDLTETWVYTTTAIALAGQQTNTGTVTGLDNSAATTVTYHNPANYFGVAPAINIVKFVNGHDADNATGPHVAAGSTATFTYVVTNTGNVALANVAVSDDRLGSIASFTGDSNGNSLLDLTETWIYTTTATALTGQQTNVGAVTAQDADFGTIVTDENPANYFGDVPAINIVKFVNGQDANSPTGPYVAAGSPVTFTYLVTNTGNVALANVVVADNKLGPITSFTGDSNSNGLLDLTETWIYTTTAPAQAGQQTNVGTVTGRDTDTGTTVTDDNPGNYFGNAPAINIVKFVNGQDAGSPTGPHVAAGSTATFTYVVTNTGNVALANVAVSDDKLGSITSFTGDTNTNGLLDLTETWIYTTTATALAGQQTNVGTVTAQDAAIGSAVADDNPANYFGDVPAIQIVEFVNGQDADSPTGPHVAAGSTATFTYVVTNTGNVALANVVVEDDKLGSIAGPVSGDTNTNGLLDLTETWIYTTTATALAGQQTNVGTVTAQDAAIGSAVADDNPANYFGDVPAIQIVEFVNGQDADSPTGPHVAAGSTATFTYVVTNTGNVALANVVVEDDKLGSIASFTGDTNTNGLLDLTETWTYTTTATAQAGQQTNTGTVTAQDVNSPPGTTVTDSDPANYFGDTNDPPRAVVLSNVHAPIAENASTALPIKISDIAVIDDGRGTNVLSLAGADAALFQITGGDLWLKAGAKLDFETNPVLDVTVRVNDPGVGGAVDAFRSLAIKITDVIETINGNNNANTLIGTTVGETINGFAGNDRIVGNGGNDRMVGGLGRDIMTGGPGNDFFVFTSIRDSAPGQSGLINNSTYGAQAGQGLRDIITDFTHGQDRIDLSAIDANTRVAGNQAFSWHGTGNFVPGRPGWLIERIYNPAGTANDKTVIYGDVNGDASADFQIELTGLKHLVATDFVL